MILRCTAMISASLQAVPSRDEPCRAAARTAPSTRSAQRSRATGAGAEHGTHARRSRGGRYAACAPRERRGEHECAASPSCAAGEGEPSGSEASVPRRIRRAPAPRARRRARPDQGSRDGAFRSIVDHETLDDRARLESEREMERRCRDELDLAALPGRESERSTARDAVVPLVPSRWKPGSAPAQS
jgi:hypothetical protein